MRLQGKAYTFDDVLLVPRRSSVASRSAVTTSAPLTRRLSLSIPIISANMDTVTEAPMAARSRAATSPASPAPATSTVTPARLESVDTSQLYWKAAGWWVDFRRLPEPREVRPRRVQSGVVAVSDG